MSCSFALPAILLLPGQFLLVPWILSYQILVEAKGCPRLRPVC